MFNCIDSDIILSKSPFNAYMLTFIFTLLITVMLILFCTLNYKDYDTMMGRVVYQNKKYYLVLAVSLDDLKNYYNDDYIMMDNQKYPYQIVEIDNNLLIDDKLGNYQNLTLEIDLPLKYQINNYLIKVKKLKTNQKIIKYFWDNFRKESI